MSQAQARKSAFITPLCTELLDEFADTHRLEKPLVYYSELLQREVTVPAGFVTDYASVPRLPLAYLITGGKGKRAACLHDWLYSGAAADRKSADRVFAEALRACGYGIVTEGLMYAGVRIGGGSHYTAPNLPQPAHVDAALAAANVEAP